MTYQRKSSTDSIGGKNQSYHLEGLSSLGKHWQAQPTTGGVQLVGALSTPLLHAEVLSIQQEQHIPWSQRSSESSRSISDTSSPPRGLQQLVGVLVIPFPHLQYLSGLVESSVTPLSTGELWQASRRLGNTSLHSEDLSREARACESTIQAQYFSGWVEVLVTSLPHLENFDRQERA